MSITYLGHTQAKTDHIETLRHFLVTQVLPSVRASEGNESCQMFQSQTDPSQFVVIEVWASVEAHRASIKNIPPKASTNTSHSSPLHPAEAIMTH